MRRKDYWIGPPKIKREYIEKLIKILNIDHNIASLLLQRNIDTYEKAKSFFCPELKDLYDPFLMKGMQKAINRILEAIKKKEGILIYGDYDVDGTTSVTIMYDFLKDHTHDHLLRYYIPDRHKEGYGLSYQGIDFAYKQGFSLIITFDCGIKDLDQAEYAYKKGINLIICDHHLPGKDLPKAIAVLDPKQTNCSYPFKELSGCGIGFKLIQALAKSISLPTPYKFLDLVAVSIASDLVPIINENRILTFCGLKLLNQGGRPGLKALKSKNVKDVCTNDILFYIGPKINSAGRLKHAKEAVKLLLSNNLTQVKEKAFKINNLNQRRKIIDQKTTEEALELIKIKEEEQLYTTVIFNPRWNKGVLGIVASKLIEIYYRPTVVFTESQGKLVASARSIEGFDLYKALEKCSPYIEKFGGHKYAAGLSLSPKSFQDFKVHFEKIVKQTIEKSQRQKKIDINCELDLSEISEKFLRILNRFEPFGVGNKQPVFLSRNLINKGYAVKIGTDKHHLKMQVGKYKENSTPKTAIGFGWGYILEEVKNKSFDMVYTIEENYWRDQISIQLIIKDLRLLYP